MKTTSSPQSISHKPQNLAKTSKAESEGSSAGPILDDPPKQASNARGSRYGRGAVDVDHVVAANRTGLVQVLDLSLVGRISKTRRPENILITKPTDDRRNNPPSLGEVFPRAAFCFVMRRLTLACDVRLAGPGGARPQSAVPMTRHGGLPPVDIEAAARSERKFQKPWGKFDRNGKS